MLRSSHVPRTPTLTKQCWVASTQPRRWHSDRPSQPTAPNALQERPSLALPLPPVLDEELIAARRSKSFKQPKPLQDAAKLTDFQKRLAANPYGMYILLIRCDDHTLILFRCSSGSCKPHPLLYLHAHEATTALPLTIHPRVSPS